MRMISRLLPVLALAGLCAAAAPAKADTFLTLQGVTFDDGGTASGFITLNPYGNVDTYEITTTAGTFLGGATYLTGTPITSPGPAIFGGGTEIVVYDGGYPEALGLVFTGDVQTSTGPTLSLVTGPGQSVECATFACTDGIGTGRYITAGDVEIPEPVSLVMLGVGLAGLAAVRRRMPTIA